MQLFRHQGADNIEDLKEEDWSDLAADLAIPRIKLRKLRESPTARGFDTVQPSPVRLLCSAKVLQPQKPPGVTIFSPSTRWHLH